MGVAVVGVLVGLNVGETVGLGVGESVGLFVGESVGLRVGEFVGLSVVGLRVGKSVRHVPHVIGQYIGI